MVLEAMACAVPVIALRWGGPAEYIDANCGILISPSNEESIVKGFHDALQLLVNDQAMQAKLGAAGRKKVELNFDWNLKIEQIMGVYRRSIAEFNP